MESKEHDFNIGNRIVHKHYGVGKIKCIEEKSFQGKSHQYFRVEGKDSIFWVPVDAVDNERIRPLASNKKIQQVIETLKSAPNQMADNYKKRSNRIQNVRTKTDLIPIAKLIRDLYARRKNKKLTTVELRNLHSLEDRLLSEWCARQDISVAEARKKLKALVNSS